MLSNNQRNKILHSYRKTRKSHHNGKKSTSSSLSSPPSSHTLSRVITNSVTHPNQKTKRLSKVAAHKSTKLTSSSPSSSKKAKTTTPSSSSYSLNLPVDTTTRAVLALIELLASYGSYRLMIHDNKTNTTFSLNEKETLHHFCRLDVHLPNDFNFWHLRALYHQNDAIEVVLPKEVTFYIVCIILRTLGSQDSNRQNNIQQIDYSNSDSDSECEHFLSLLDPCIGGNKEVERDEVVEDRVEEEEVASDIAIAHNSSDSDINSNNGDYNTDSNDKQLLFIAESQSNDAHSVEIVKDNTNTNPNLNIEINIINKDDNVANDDDIDLNVADD